MPSRTSDNPRRKKAPDNYDIEVGRRIRVQRLAKNMSQTKLADHLGVTFQQVQKYEKGMNRVGAGRLQHIAELFEVPISFFYGANDRNAPQSNEMLHFLDTARALRLVQAYSRIRDEKQQALIVQLVESIAPEK